MVVGVRLGGIVALAVWLAGVSGLLGSGPAVNWIALVSGLVLLALAGAAGPD